MSGGPSADLHAYRAYIAINFPFVGWAKILLFTMLGPDLEEKQWIFLELGQYAETTDSYDLSVNVADIFGIPIGPHIGRATMNSLGIGTDHIDLSVAGIPGYRISSIEIPMKNPNFPFKDGYGEYRNMNTGQLHSEGFYWAKAFLASLTSVTYNDVQYYGYGTAWIDHQWRGVGNVKWNWLSAQILGCLDENDEVIDPEDCPFIGMTVAAFDIKAKDSGDPIRHSLDIITAPKECADHSYEALNTWTFTEGDLWTSPHTGITFATELRLEAPAEVLDIFFRAYVDDQEIEALPDFRSWEGAGFIKGTYQGIKIFGEGYLEQFQRD